jgi:phage terminase small subunit
MEYNPVQYEILRTVFRQMDQELGLKPLTDEQLKEIKVKEQDETDE